MEASQARIHFAAVPEGVCGSTGRILLVVMQVRRMYASGSSVRWHCWKNWSLHRARDFGSQERGGELGIWPFETPHRVVARDSEPPLHAAGSIRSPNSETMFGIKIRRGRPPRPARLANVSVPATMHRPFVAPPQSAGPCSYECSRHGKLAVPRVSMTVLAWPRVGNAGGRSFAPRQQGVLGAGQWCAREIAQLLFMADYSLHFPRRSQVAAMTRTFHGLAPRILSFWHRSRQPLDSRLCPEQKPRESP